MGSTSQLPTSRLNKSAFSPSSGADAMSAAIKPCAPSTFCVTAPAENVSELKACVMSRVDRSNFATLGQQHAGCFRIPAQFRLARGGKPNFRRRCVKIALESETKMGVAGKTQLERKRG